MEKITITKVFISDKSKDGKEFKSRDGKKFWKVAIKTKEYPDNWVSSLIFKKEDPRFFWEDKIKDGEFTETLRVFQDEESGYWNFELPTWKDGIESRLTKLESWVKATSQNMNELP